MEKFRSYVLPAFLIITLHFSVPGNLFAQTNQKENLPALRDSVTTTNENTKPVQGITSGRAKALAGTFAALISLALGLRMKRRVNNANGSEKPSAIVALVLGLTAVTLSLLHLQSSITARFGTGSGKAGAIVSLIIGLTGVVLVITKWKHQKP